MNEETLSHTETSFLNKRFKQTLLTHKEVLDKYKAGFDKAIKLDTGIPIFLDANVLLRIYSISFKARDQMKTFLNDHLSNIVITSQVQWEYVKNRENVINRFFKDVTMKIPEVFTSEVINHIEEFINSHKIVLGDYEKVEKKLTAIKKSADEILRQIETEVKKKKDLKDSTLFEDEFLTLFSKATLLESLSDQQITKVKNEYDKCMESYDKNDLESFKAFPGSGEKKEKSDDPYGDYIIFQEMMQYSKTQKTDAIFLTYDTTKGDWMRKDGSPHLHYVENFYLNTGQLIYILNAERLLETLFETSFESLIATDTIKNDAVNRDSLLKFLLNNKWLNLFKSITVSDHYIQELILNNINNLEMLNSLFNNSTYNLNGFFNYIYQNHPSLTKYGALRGFLILEIAEFTMRDEHLNIVPGYGLRKSVEKWKNEFSI